MKAWQGYAHAAVVALSVWFCRETIFEALQWWNARPPSDGLLLGSCILLTGLACVAIVALHFSHVMVWIHFLLFSYLLYKLLFVIHKNNLVSFLLEKVLFNDSIMLPIPSLLVKL